MVNSTHYRNKAKSSKKLYFQVLGDTIYLLHANGRKEDVTANELLDNLIPISKDKNKIELDGTCQIIGLGLTDEPEQSSLPSFNNLKEDFSWILNPIKKEIIELLKNNPEAVITGVKLTYEIPATEKVVHIEI